MSEDVLFTQEGQLGVITLNRPSALNTLTLDMILEIQKHLSLWKKDDAIHAILLKAVPGNAFCAGGDVRWLYYSRNSNDTDPMQFFWHEYRLNHFIHHLGKPYISLIDGMVMGGGVGVSLHGSHPVASERFIFAMPETSIGFFPDIGASYLLTRCPGHLGIYLGLTGNRLNSQEAMNAGLIKKTVPSGQMPALFDALMHEDLSENAFTRVDRCLDSFANAADSDHSLQFEPLIDICFKHSTVEMIRESLHSAGSDWARGMDHLLAQKSPLSLKVTLAQLQRAKGLTLAQCLQMDYDLVGHFMQGHDFYEGVRALLIDKDKNPKWEPDRLNLVSEERVNEHFRHSHVLSF